MREEADDRPGSAHLLVATLSTISAQEGQGHGRYDVAGLANLYACAEATSTEQFSLSLDTLELTVDAFMFC